MGIDKELIDKLLAGYKGPEDLIGEQGLLKQLTKALVERAMHAELTHHLGYEKHDSSGKGGGNSRNKTSTKTLKGDFGEVEIEVPGDRQGSFEPKIVARHQRRFSGFDDKILSMYARGMTTREIQGHLQEIYGVEVSPSLISEVTDAVMEEAKAWQTRPLESLYPILFLDALMVKMRHEGRAENRAVYVAIGIDLDGRKDVLELWTSDNEGAKFWVYVGDDDHPYNVFDFTLNRGRDGPKYFLRDYNQVLLADAYGGYNGVVAGNAITRAGCWAHLRRRFIDAEKVAPEIAREAVEMIRMLYAVEKQARDVSAGERLALRQAQSAPLLTQIREKLLLWKEQLLPKHPMAEAINYALSQWREMNVFCSDGAVAIDNNTSEREMKRVVLHRKNSLFVGNPRGGRTAAILATLTSTCRRHDIDPNSTSPSC